MDSEVLLHPHDHKRKKDWEAIFNFFDKYLFYENIKNSLDLGGGRGDISYHILKKNSFGIATCIDVDQKLLDEAKKRNDRIKTLNFDINQKLPFENNSMDLVSSVGTLTFPYVNSFESVFSEMARVSKKYVVVDFLYQYGIWPLLIKLRYPGIPPKRNTLAQMKKMAKNNNLKIIAKFGTRISWGRIFPLLGRVTILILEK